MDEKLKRKMTYHIDALCDLGRQKVRINYWEKQVDLICDNARNEFVDEVRNLLDGNSGFVRVRGVCFSAVFVDGVLRNWSRALDLGGDVAGSDKLDALESYESKAMRLQGKISLRKKEIVEEIASCQSGLWMVMDNANFKKFADIDFTTKNNSGTIRYDRRGVRLI